MTLPTAMGSGSPPKTSQVASGPRARLYRTRRDHLRALWAERLRAAAKVEEVEEVARDEVAGETAQGGGPPRAQGEECTVCQDARPDSLMLPLSSPDL